MVESGENIPAPAEAPIVLPLPNMDEDIDTMMMLGKHYILNYIMKQVAKLLKGIPYHYKDVKNYPLEEQKKWEQACKE